MRMLFSLNENKRLVIGLVCLVLVVVYLYNSKKSLEKQNVVLKNNIDTLQTQLQQCKATTDELVKELSIQQNQYKQRVEKLMKKANTPTLQVKVNENLPDDYEKIKAMIDEVLEKEYGIK